MQVFFKGGEKENKIKKIKYNDLGGHMNVFDASLLQEKNKMGYYFPEKKIDLEFYLITRYLKHKVFRKKNM